MKHQGVSVAQLVGTNRGVKPPWASAVFVTDSGDGSATKALPATGASKQALGISLSQGNATRIFVPHGVVVSRPQHGCAHDALCCPVVFPCVFSAALRLGFLFWLRLQRCVDEF